MFCSAIKHRNAACIQIGASTTQSKREQTIDNNESALRFYFQFA